MERRPFGPLPPVSVLTLGGGGTGQVYGKTDRAEAVATVREAVASGITFLDVAPTYGRGEAERVIGEAFEGRLPEGVGLATKCFIDGDPAPDDVPVMFERSLRASLERMRLDHVDLFFLHGPLVPGDTSLPFKGTSRTLFVEAARPALEALVRRGLTRHWGMTAVGFPDELIRAFGEIPRPAAVQAVTNLLDSPGNMHVFPGPSRAREIVAAAAAHGIGVMGIRALAAGALARELDRQLDHQRPEMIDHARAQPFLELCREWGASPALLAHRYALSLPGVATVILGVKDRSELRECVAAAEAGPLGTDEMRAIDARVRGGQMEVHS